MRVSFAVAMAAMFAVAGVTGAAEVAYFRFEEGAAGAEFQYPVSPGGPGSGIAFDSAGGDDGMRIWS